ncbi:MAG: hypothetical protein K2L54_01510, partial [Clostridiales bacterium]|nr:hypothetical protein [Clostridiales bacterium]
DENGGLKLVYCEQIVIYEVNITLCDGSQLHQNLLWGEKIDFDCETWKIESGYAYYYECSNGNGSWRNYLDTGCGYLDIPADNYNITLHKVIADQEKSFDLTGDGYTVTGKANVYYSADNRLYYIQITPDNTTINGQTVTVYQNIADFYETKMQITRFTAADFSYVTSDEETIHITETFMLYVFWEFDNDGNLTVTSAELKSNTVIGYSHSSTSSNSISWNVNITDNSAEIVYSVDGDIVAVNECNLSELSNGDRNKAVIAEHAVSDGNDGRQVVKYLIYIDVETADNGEVVINGLCYKKEIVPTV